MQIKSSPYQSFCTWPFYETEVKSNSEFACLQRKREEKNGVENGDKIYVQNRLSHEHVRYLLIAGSTSKHTAPPLYKKVVNHPPPPLPNPYLVQFVRFVTFLFLLSLIDSFWCLLQEIIMLKLWISNNSIALLGGLDFTQNVSVLLFLYRIYQVFPRRWRNFTY